MGFFGLFNFDKPGPGVYKDGPEKRGFFLFFDIFVRKFWRLVSLSLSYTLFAIPAFIAFFWVGTFLQMAFSPIKDTAFVFYMSIYLSLFLTSFMGAGPGSAGHAYVLRNFAREEHAWVWDDFVSNTKENFWKGLFLFLLDIVLLIVLVGAAYLYFANSAAMPIPPFVSMVLGFFALSILFMYLMMHFFLYPLMVTMDMSLGGILKTALQLTLRHLPSCILVFLASLVVFAVFFMLFYLNLGFIMLFAALGFSATTFAYIYYGTSVIDEELRQNNRL